MKTWTNGLLRNEAEGSPEGGGGVASLSEGGSSESASVGSLTDTSVTQGEGTWRDNLSVGDDVKNWQGFENIKDPSDAITQLYNAQKIMGAEKIAKPQESWTDEQWQSHYRDLGAPASADGYELNVADAAKEALSEEDIAATKELYAKAGLSQKQVNILNDGSNEMLTSKMEAQNEARQQKIDADLRNLQVEWGDSFAQKLDIAKAAVKKIGGDDLVKALDEVGAAQHPAFIKAFAEVGNSYMEASGAKGPLGNGMIVSNQAQAAQLLKERNRDPDWTAALMDKNNAAHEDVVAERAELYKMAYSS